MGGVSCPGCAPSSSSLAEEQPWRCSAVAKHPWAQHRAETRPHTRCSGENRHFPAKPHTSSRASALWYPHPAPSPVSPSAAARLPWARDELIGAASSARQHASARRAGPLRRRQRGRVCRGLALGTLPARGCSLRLRGSAFALELPEVSLALLWQQLLPQRGASCGKCQTSASAARPVPATPVRPEGRCGRSGCNCWTRGKRHRGTACSLQASPLPPQGSSLPAAGSVQSPSHRQGQQHEPRLSPGSPPAVPARRPATGSALWSRPRWQPSLPLPSSCTTAARRRGRKARSWAAASSCGDGAACLVLLLLAPARVPTAGPGPTLSCRVSVTVLPAGASAAAKATPRSSALGLCLVPTLRPRSSMHGRCSHRERCRHRGCASLSGTRCRRRAAAPGWCGVTSGPMAAAGQRGCRGPGPPARAATSRWCCPPH